MANNFFITGYPRSRTSWLANFLTTDRSLCFHDALAECASVEHFIDKVLVAGSTYGQSYIGDSDSGLLFAHEPIRERFPDAKWVVVIRDEKDVVTSLVNSLGPTHDYEAVIEFLRSMLRSVLSIPGVMTIKYEDLNSFETCFKIWEFCLPGIMQNYPRWELLNGLKTEPFLTKYLSKLCFTHSQVIR
jgi:hypothetical protein